MEDFAVDLDVHQILAVFGVRLNQVRVGLRIDINTHHQQILKRRERHPDQYRRYGGVVAVNVLTHGEDLIQHAGLGDVVQLWY